MLTLKTFAVKNSRGEFVLVSEVYDLGDEQWDGILIGPEAALRDLLNEYASDPDKYTVVPLDLS